MPLVGYTAARGGLSLGGALAAASAGATAGSLALYVLARLLPVETPYQLVDRGGRWLGLRRRHVALAERWFDRHARATLLLGRLVPGVRTAVPLAAGVRRLPLGSTLAYSALGSSLSCVVLGLLGFAFGDSISIIARAGTAVQYGLVIVVVVTVGALILAQLLRRR